MASSLLNQLTPLFIIMGLAALLGVLHLMNGWPRWIYGRAERLTTQATRRPHGDEEKGRPNPQRVSLVYLDNLPRYRPSSATAPMLPNAAPPAYLPGTRRAASPADLPPRPIVDLPLLDLGNRPAASLRQQSRPQDLPFGFSNNSTESLETVVSPWEQSPSQIRIPLGSASTESIKTEVTDFIHSASTSTYFQAPAANSPAWGHFRFHSPLPLPLQSHTSTGTVQAHKPIVVSTVSPEADTAIGSVSDMVKSIETGASTKLSSRSERFDQGEPPPSPLLNSVLNRITNARERWTRIDLYACPSLS
jgi:hypothetical protein